MPPWGQMKKTEEGRDQSKDKNLRRKFSSTESQNNLRDYSEEPQQKIPSMKQTYNKQATLAELQQQQQNAENGKSGNNLLSQMTNFSQLIKSFRNFDISR